MNVKRPTVGDYNFQNIASPYQPDLSAIMPHQQLWGLSLQSQYLYGGLMTDSGTTVIVERKFIGPMSGGNYLLTNQSGKMELDPASARSAKGELVRSFEPLKCHWASKGMLHNTDELSIDLTITDDTMSGSRAMH